MSVPAGAFHPPGATIYPAYLYGFTAYQWKLDGAAFSADVPAGTPITLTGLAPGTHTLQVRGKTTAGDIRPPPPSVVWTIDPTYSPRSASTKCLATNTNAYRKRNRLSRRHRTLQPRHHHSRPQRWGHLRRPPSSLQIFFPPGTLLPAGEYLVLIAAVPDGNPGLFLGFSLDGDGDNAVSTASPALRDGVVDKSLRPQIPNLSVGRTGPTHRLGP